MTNKKVYADGAAGAIGKIHAFEKFGSILGLERMNELMALLGNPQDKLKVLHVAGTNGKGSVCRYLYSVLQENGYRTGLYTSPFLEVFNERIELDGAYISDADLTEYTDRVLKQVQRMVDADVYKRQTLGRGRGRQKGRSLRLSDVPEEHAQAAAPVHAVHHRRDLGLPAARRGRTGVSDQRRMAGNEPALSISAGSQDGRDGDGGNQGNPKHQGREECRAVQKDQGDHPGGEMCIRDRAGGHQGLVYLPSALVGTPDPGLLLRGLRRDCRCLRHAGKMSEMRLHALQAG